MHGREISSGLIFCNLPSGDDETIFRRDEIRLKQSRANAPRIVIPVLSLRGAESTARMPIHSSAPICLLCQQPMHVARTIPAVARLPEVLVFHCEGCGEVETRERGHAACLR
jgi:hypothetical protein